MKNKLLVKKSTAGLGLFAGDPIKRGTRVIEYFGEMIPTEEADKRGGRYLFDIDKNWTIDGKERANIARYINHSCVPNCYAEVDLDRKKVFIFAKRNIKEGEELSYNYGKSYWRDIIGGEKKCRCEKCKKSRKK